MYQTRIVVVGFDEARRHIIHKLHELSNTWMFMEAYDENASYPMYETNQTFRKYVDKTMDIVIKSVLFFVMAKNDACYQNEYVQTREELRKTLLSNYGDEYTVDQFVSMLELAVIQNLTLYIPDIDDDRLILDNFKFLGAGDVALLFVLR